jgi:hypothetical protein
VAIAAFVDLLRRVCKHIAIHIKGFEGILFYELTSFEFLDHVHLLNDRFLLLFDDLFHKLDAVMVLGL